MRGHIRRRGERSWEIKFDLGRNPFTGKRITRYQSFKGTKKDAQLELARLVTSAGDGTYVDPSKLTLAEFLERWERDWAMPNVSPKTLERYQELMHNHVRPHVGATRLQRLRPVHLSELYAKLLREGRGPSRGLSARTVGHVHRVLHRALGHAVKWDLVKQNVAGAVKPPPVASAEIEILRASQIKPLLEALRGRALYPLAVLALATGMRRGELVALRWKDVDFDAGKVRVERSLEQTGKGLRFKEPKTKHGRRTIALPSSATAELRAHWKAQQEHRLALGLGRADGDTLVFCRWDGAPRAPDSLTKDWKAATTDLKLPAVTLHALRHTHASQLIESGLDVLTISRRLGHGSPAITLSVYGHLFSNSDDRAAQVLEAAFNAARTD